MLPVVTAEEMRALDRATTDEVGLPALVLMETAGRAVAAGVLRVLGASRGHVAVVCGPGNTGGDGFVAARVLRDQSVDAVVYLAVERTAVAGDARRHLDIYERAASWSATATKVRVIIEGMDESQLQGWAEEVAGALAKSCGAAT